MHQKMEAIKTFQKVINKNTLQNITLTTVSLNQRTVLGKIINGKCYVNLENNLLVLKDLISIDNLQTINCLKTNKKIHHNSYMVYVQNGININTNFMFDTIFFNITDSRLNENETMNIHYNAKVNLENGVLYLLKYLEDIRVVQ